MLHHRVSEHIDAYSKCFDIKPACPCNILLGNSLMPHAMSSTLNKTSIVSGSLPNCIASDKIVIYGNLYIISFMSTLFLL